jgi:hypothetical protein
VTWDFISSRTVKAAKPHKCDECRATIEKGERHDYTAGRVEGDFTSYRLCLPCAELAAAYCREFDDGEGFPLGEIRSTLRDYEGVEDIDAWIAESKAREVDRRVRDAARRGRIEALADTVICERCGATVATYGDKCSAALDDRCPGFEAIERARAEPVT